MDDIITCFELHGSLLGRVAIHRFTNDG